MAKSMLVIGCRGQLGSDVMSAAGRAGYRVSGCDVPEIDFLKPDTVTRAVGQSRADVVVNCAAFTAVDACESPANRPTVWAVNCDGVAACASAARDIGAVFVHISTDYVFDGCKSGPYVESDAPAPRTEYGKSKLAGEQALQSITENHIIFRIAWLYGMRGANFVKTIRSAAAKNALTGTPLRVVKDQLGSPTSTVQVCRQILTVLDTQERGLFHATCEGSCSWFDFASLIVSSLGIDVAVNPCTTAEFPRPAPRPANSVLENARLKKLGLNVMADWKTAFREFLEEANQSP